MAPASPLYPLRTCASCRARKVLARQFKLYAACEGAVYCGRDCQLAAWLAHTAVCEAARKAAAASDDGAGPVAAS